MGLFDRFIKKENNIEKQITKVPEKTDSYLITRNKEGKTQIEYIEANVPFKQFYDTTKLIIDEICGDLVNARISWYNQNDAVVIDPSGEFGGRRGNYKEILTKIDFELFQKDSNYVEALMKKLLNEKRVNEYLYRGMIENPEQPCGKYVGQIEKRDNQYMKVFEKHIGVMSHYSVEMVVKRQKYMEQIEQARKAELQDKINKMNKLQEEIKDLEKEDF